MKLLEQLPPDAVKLALVLAFSFLIGLEREEHAAGEKARSFGGVRTFPLIGLLGYGLSVVSGTMMLPLAAGVVVLGGMMALSYYRKLSREDSTGITSELSGLVIYTLGALVAANHLWIAATVGVSSLFLLELKAGLENMARRVSPVEIAAAAKFLLLAAVLLPIVPNETFTPFNLNPFHITLVVVAVSGISFFSFTLQKLTESSSSVLLSAILGGAYSSTATTVALAKQAQKAEQPALYAGSIVTASGVMYVRLALLLALFNTELFARLGPAFLVLAAVTIGGGVAWARSANRKSKDKPHPTSRNPLEMRAALLFALIFVAITVLTRLVSAHLGRGGLYGLAAVVGAADVDPFILGLAQHHVTTVGSASAAIAIAAASNNVAKGAYAWFFARGKTGLQAAAGMGALAALGLVPLIWA